MITPNFIHRRSSHTTAATNHYLVEMSELQSTCFSDILKENIHDITYIVIATHRQRNLGKREMD